MVLKIQKRLTEVERQMATKVSSDSKKEFSNSQLDVAIIYAEPLRVKRDQVFFQTVETLDYETECYKIVKDLKVANINISIQIEIATRENFLQIIQKSPKVLHVICHGVYSEEKKDYCLCFEDEKGHTDLVSSSELKEWFKSYNLQTKMVFTNACHSEQVARVFYDAGVPCVVAIQSNYKIYDQASQEFAKSFYKSLLVHGFSPYDAFLTAKKTLISAYSSEITKFIMLPEGYQDSVFSPARSGPPQIISHEKFLKPDFPVNQVVSRNKDLFPLLNDLLNDSIRVVVFYGEPGSGKTTLIKRLANYLSIRSHFHDKICLIEMRGIKSIDQLKSELASKILNPYENYDFTDLNGLLEPIRHKEILIILEDCDNFISKHQSNLLTMIENIVGKTSRLKFLLTVSKVKPTGEWFSSREINSKIGLPDAIKIIAQIASIVFSEDLNRIEYQLKTKLLKPYKLPDIYWIAREFRKSNGLFENIVEKLLKLKNQQKDANSKEEEDFSNILKNLEYLFIHIYSHTLIIYLLL